MYYVREGRLLDRLAIAIAKDAMTVGQSLLVPVAARVADQLFKERGSPVLSYYYEANNLPAFVGLADLTGLQFGGSPDEVKVVMTHTRRFGMPRFEPAPARASRRQPYMRLSVDRFTAILAQRDPDPDVASESPEGFTAGAATLESISAAYHRALEDYELRCPFTDRLSARSLGSNPMLNVEPIIPFHAKGTLAPDNLLVMAPDVLSAWRDGLLTLDDDFHFVVKAGISPETQASLRSSGRLRLPRSGTVPSLESLAFHRRAVCGL